MLTSHAVSKSADWTSLLRLAVICLPFELISLGGCTVGQSGNEGEMPAAPCADGTSLFEAEIISLESGCVTVQIVRVLSQGGGITNQNGDRLLDDLQVGDQLTAKSGTIYAYTHTFSEGQAVIVLPGQWGEMLEFQLLPLTSTGVEVHWGSRFGYATTDDLVANDCAERLEKLPDEGSGEEKSAKSVEAAPPEPNCTKTASP